MACLDDPTSLLYEEVQKTYLRFTPLFKVNPKSSSGSISYNNWYCGVLELAKVTPAINIVKKIIRHVAMQPTNDESKGFAIKLGLAPKQSHFSIISHKILNIFFENFLGRAPS